MRMSCSRHEGDWDPPEYGRIPVVCFGLLFGRHHAVWCDVGHGGKLYDVKGESAAVSGGQAVTDVTPNCVVTTKQ